MSSNGKYLSLGAHRATMNAGKARIVVRKLAHDEPDLAGVDIVLLQRLKVVLWKFAQCGQEAEAYSMIVTLAVSGPRPFRRWLGYH